jgi:hypothetical protein
MRTFGAVNKLESITVDNQNLHVTQNLHAALLHLQDHLCSRVIWVDAICIDQANEKEKENQLPLMAQIYAKARRAVVWLGMGDDSSDYALDVIRLAGDSSPRLLTTGLARQALLQLLQQRWFRRIWVRNQSFKCFSD